jgi:hypothetical protein
VSARLLQLSCNTNPVLRFQQPAPPKIDTLLRWVTWRPR